MHLVPCITLLAEELNANGFFGMSKIGSALLEGLALF